MTASFERVSVIVMLPMCRTAATTRNRSSCSAAVKPTVSSAFYNRLSTVRAKTGRSHLQQRPLFFVVDPVNFSPTLVQVLVVFNITIQKQCLCGVV